MNENEEVSTNVVDDPYVGPRPFEKKDKKFYFGRRREADKILSSLLARRLLLLYAQSGAGKTSLINALLIPVLENSGQGSDGPLLSYSHRRFEVLPVGRVGDAIKPESKVDNIFAFNLMVSLAGNHHPERFANLQLSNFLLDSVYVDGQLIYIGSQLEPGDVEDESKQYQEIAGLPLMSRVLIIDQFEELFTFHPQLEKERREFLEQLDEAMQKDPYLYVLLSMRDDYLGRIATYAQLLPDGLRPRYNMKRMDESAVLEAIQCPPEKVHPPRCFDEEVSSKLVKYLHRSGSVDEQPADEQDQLELHIEPVQLQVVCLQLWESLDNSAGGVITIEEVNDAVQKMADDGDPAKGEPLAAFIDTALATYYEQAMAGVVSAARGELPEFKLRNFFSSELITAAGVRNLVARGDEDTKDIPESTIKLLEDKYHLIRNDMRAGRPFVELVHDSFIIPILETNKRWEELRLQKIPWLGAARIFRESPDLTPLLAGDHLKLAQAQAENMELREEEREYLETSIDAQRARQFKIRLLAVFGTVVLLLFLALTTLSIFLYKQRQDLVTAVNEKKLLHLANILLGDNLAPENNPDKPENIPNIENYEEAILLSYYATKEILPKLRYQGFLANFINSKSPAQPDTLRYQGFLFDSINWKLTAQQDWGSPELDQLRGRYLPPVDNDQNPLPVNNLFQGPKPGTLATVNNGQVLWWSAVEAGEDPPVVDTFPLQMDIPVNYAVFSQDYKLLASSHGPDLRLWWIGTEMEQDSIMLGERETEITALAFSADSRRLAVARGCSQQGKGDCSTQTIEVWEINSASPYVQQIDSHNLNYGPIVDLAFIDEQGDELIWVSLKSIGIKALKNRESQILDTQLVKSFVINAVAVVPDKNLLVIAGCDKNFFLGESKCLRSDTSFLEWRFINDQEITGLHPRSEQEIALADIAILPEKQQVVFVNKFGEFTRWSIDFDYYQEVACKVASRQLTGTEWESAFRGLGDNEYVAICDDQFGINKSIVEELIRDCDRDALNKAKDSWEQGHKTTGSEEVGSFNEWVARIVTDEILERGKARAQLCRDELESVLEEASATQTIEDVMSTKTAIVNAKNSLYSADYDKAFEQSAEIADVIQRLPDGLRTIFEFEMADVYKDLCTGGGLKQEDAEVACGRIPVLDVGVESGGERTEQRYWQLDGGDTGDYLTIEVKSLQGDANVLLNLHDNQFRKVTPFNEVSHGMSSQIEAFLLQDGPYFLEVQQSNPAPYTVSMAVMAPQTIRIGEEVEANEDQRFWQFNGQAGEHLKVEIQAKMGGEPRLVLYDSHLAMLPSQPSYGGGNIGTELLLPVDGDYYLEVSWLQDAEPYILSTAVPETETIQIGEEVDANADQRYWQFSGETCEHVTIDVTASEDGNPWLSLLNNSFEEIYFNHDSDEQSLNPRIDRFLQEDGLYYIEVGWDDEPVPYVISIASDSD